MSTEPDRVNLETPDIAAENRAAIEALFPGVLADGVLDATRLGELLETEVAAPADGPERFGLMWAGKQQAVKSLLTPGRGTLVPEFDKSIGDFDEARHVLIEGDNLEVLKLLQKAYNDKVKLIYIDPPYNTGNDFVYDDDFSDTLRAYLEFTGQLDDDGNRTSASADISGRRHSRWLSMIYPRLVLARNLLTPDGVIFVSIDDNEIANLRLVLDEVFGPENFIATFIWEKRQNRENRKEVSYRHDTLLCYARERSAGRVLSQLPMTEKALANYANPDGDPRGLWKSDPAIAQAGHATAAQFYTLTTPAGRKLDPPSGSAWRFTEARFNELVEDGRMWFGKDGTGVPRIKTYLDAKDRGLTPETIIFATDAGTNESAKNDLRNLFGGVAAFDTPKPVALLQTLIRMGSGPSSTLLDFFAGSGTMGEAVLRLNAEDGGTRRVVQVQLPEVLPEDSEARRLGHGTVADIARDRWDRVADDLGSDADAALRYLALGRSNFRATDDREATDLLALADTTLLGNEDVFESIAAEILLKEGVALDEEWARGTAGDATVIMAGGVAVILSLKITDDVTTEAFALGARVVVFLEDGFAGCDAAKANAVTNARNLGITMKTV